MAEKVAENVAENREIPRADDDIDSENEQVQTRPSSSLMHAEPTLSSVTDGLAAENGEISGQDSRTGETRSNSVTNGAQPWGSSGFGERAETREKSPILEKIEFFNALEKNSPSRQSEGKEGQESCKGDKVSQGNWVLVPEMAAAEKLDLNATWRVVAAKHTERAQGREEGLLDMRPRWNRVFSE